MKVFVTNIFTGKTEDFDALIENELSQIANNESYAICELTNNGDVLIKKHNLKSLDFSNGLKSVYKVNKLIVLACGLDKSEIIKRFIESEFESAIKCWSIKRHPNCTLYIDDDAYSLMK